MNMMKHHKCVAATPQHITASLSITVQQRTAMTSFASPSLQNNNNNNSNHQINSNKNTLSVLPSTLPADLDLNKELEWMNQILMEQEPTHNNNETMEMDSVKRKRKKKIKRHKFRKRLKETRAERKRLGKK